MEEMGERTEMALTPTNDAQQLPSPVPESSAATTVPTDTLMCEADQQNACATDPSVSKLEEELGTSQPKIVLKLKRRKMETEQVNSRITAEDAAPVLPKARKPSQRKRTTKARKQFKIPIELSREEIKADLLEIFESKPCPQLDKRPQETQLWYDSLTPGLWLPSMRF